MPPKIFDCYATFSGVNYFSAVVCVPFTLRTHQVLLYNELMLAYASVEGGNSILVNYHVSL